MFFCEYCKIFKNIYFEKYLRTTLSVNSRAVLFQEPCFTRQVDSPESPETPEITEIMENFIKVAKHFTKLKDTLTNYVWEKSHFKKQ